MHRLHGPLVEIDDGQPSKRKPGDAVRPRSLTVGTAMRHTHGHLVKDPHHLGSRRRRCHRSRTRRSRLYPGHATPRLCRHSAGVQTSGAMSMRPNILVISFSDLAADPRVDRQIRFLRSRYTVVAAGLEPPGCDVDEFINISTAAPSVLERFIWRAWIVARRFQDAYWKHPKYEQVLARLGAVHADAVVANELEALPIALRLGPPVLFDAHEYAPREFDHITRWRLFVGPYAAWQVRRYVPRCGDDDGGWSYRR